MFGRKKPGEKSQIRADCSTWQLNVMNAFRFAPENQEDIIEKLIKFAYTS